MKTKNTKKNAYKFLMLATLDPKFTFKTKRKIHVKPCSLILRETLACHQNMT
jgi:hypothetical protein